jgi:hypothetical protein
MGGHGLGAILNLAGLRSWINNLPADDANRGVDFAEFSAIHGSLEEMYGPRAGRGLARRAAWTAFPKALRTYGTIAGVTSLSFKILPLRKKLERGLPAMAQGASAITAMSSPSTVVLSAGDGTRRPLLALPSPAYWKRPCSGHREANPSGSRRPNVPRSAGNAAPSALTGSRWSELVGERQACNSSRSSFPPTMRSRI